MHPERVVITRVSAVVVTAVVITVATTVRAFGTLLLGHLFPII
jgi:multisubunit Na+/H+ antiporter MnhC subunit